MHKGSSITTTKERLLQHFVFSYGLLLLCVYGCNSQDIIPLGTLHANSDNYDRFACSVSISGDTIVVGAFLEDSNAVGVNGDPSDNSSPDSGAAYVFVRDGPSWTQQAYLKASNTGDDDYFGYSVSISGDTIVVGAIQEDSNATGVNGDQDNNDAINSGAVYVFVRNGITWSQQAYLKASNTGYGDWFGRSVSISGDTIVVGANGESSDATGVNGDQNNDYALHSGAAYVFVRSGTTWTQQAYLKASNAEAADFFGDSVSISGDTIVVGAPDEDSDAAGVNGDQNNNGASSAGAAYVFVRNGETWSQQAYLKASNTGEYDRFGAAVSISGDTIVVGAYREGSNATGVNGDQNNDNQYNSGAAYVFVRVGTAWSVQAYLKASNTGFNDLFGTSVSISGDTIVVGATGEDSNATGVNGDQNNDGANDAGAAYVFVRNGPTWTQQAYLKASETFEFGCTVAVGEIIVASECNGDRAYMFGSVVTTSTDDTTASSSIADGALELDDELVMILIIAGSACVLVACVLIIVVVIIRRRRRKFNFKNDQSVSLEPVAEDSQSHYQRMTLPGSPHLERPGSGIQVAITDEKLAPMKSYAINYSELQMLERVGEGAFGTVHKAIYRHQEVAVKQLKSNLDQNELENFHTEVSVLMTLKSHANVAGEYSLFDVAYIISVFIGICASPLCIVLEYVGGGSIEKRYKQTDLSLQQILKMCRDTAAGMAHLHAEGIVHRDLACRNLLLTETDRVKIVDFGMSRWTQDEATTKSDTGPLKWMAPESITDRKYSTKSDVWAFGCVIVEMVTRQKPYPDLLPHEAASKVAYLGLRPEIPTKNRLNLPPQFIIMFDSCFARSPESRPDFHSMCDVLTQLVSH